GAPCTSATGSAGAASAANARARAPARARRERVAGFGWGVLMASGSAVVFVRRLSGWGVCDPGLRNPRKNPPDTGSLQLAQQRLVLLLHLRPADPGREPHDAGEGLLGLAAATFLVQHEGGVVPGLVELHGLGAGRAEAQRDGPPLGERGAPGGLTGRRLVLDEHPLLHQRLDRPRVLLDELGDQRLGLTEAALAAEGGRQLQSGAEGPHVRGGLGLLLVAAVRLEDPLE